ncbi:hypothetical protein [Sulfitobacter pacificus]|uniref:hypothetical protein n=1 Tax=Sulfitobacter pacificus TaxID=1499314 RepID=UPI0024E187E0|nr:hypothetical protein [Sulfitobacter pacificus]
MFFLPFLIIVVIAVAIYANRNKDRRRCRWRQTTRESSGGLIRYNCITCGQETARSDGVPRQCLAQSGKPEA